jgi:hypothetical protein
MMFFALEKDKTRQIRLATTRDPDTLHPTVILSLSFVFFDLSPWPNTYLR